MAEWHFFRFIVLELTMSLCYNQYMQLRTNGCICMKNAIVKCGAGSIFFMITRRF